MKTKTTIFALVSVWLAVSTACNEVGSCRYATSGEYDYCEDYLGSEYNQSAAQVVCSSNTGTWSSSHCSVKGAIATCAIDVGGGSAQNFQYTYYQTSDPTTIAEVMLQAEAHCGLAGGTFTAE